MCQITRKIQLFDDITMKLLINCRFVLHVTGGCFM